MKKIYNSFPTSFVPRKGMIVKMIRKTKIILFVISVILSAVILCFFLTGYYSIDTERIYFQGYTDYAVKDAYIRDGRFISAIIFVIIGIWNPTIKIMHIISVIISIFILSLCVIQIYDVIENCKKSQNRKEKMIAFLLSYTYIFNFLIVDILKFIDGFVISLSILCFIIAIKKIVIEKKEKIGFALTFLGVICYQGTIPVYIATAILVSILKNKIINKEFFKNILTCAIAIFVSAFISMILINLVPIITGMELTNKLEGKNFFDTLKQNIFAINEVIFHSLYFFPSYVWIGMSMIIIVTSIIVAIQKKKIVFSFNVLFVFIAYVLALLVMFPIQNIQMAPRVAYVIGQSVAGILIYIYCTNFGEIKSKLYINFIIIIMILYFIITMFSVLKSTYDLKLANTLDKNFSKAIENEIERLEEQGIAIHKIGIRYTENGKNIKKYSKLTRMDSFYIVGYTLQRYEFYTGKKITARVQDFTEDLEKECFKESEEEIQFYHKEDILYILINL